MEKKIDIAELLKDCPKGMELDCTMFDNVSFLRIQNGTNQIIICTPDGLRFLNSYGCYHDDYSAKCVIFPKGKNTWDGFVPPCKFKDGDVITCTNSVCSFVAIFKKMYTDTTFIRYVSLALDDEQLDIKDSWSDFKKPRFATEEEKEKLFNALKNNGYRWNAETKTLEKLVKPKFKVGNRIKNIDNCRSSIVAEIKDDCFIIKTLDGLHNSYLTDKLPFSKQDNWELVPSKFDINTLKPFESKVLVRDSEAEKWKPAIWGYYDSDETYDYPYEVVGGIGFSMCIPYEENKHLRGKTDDCSSFYKTWE